MKKFCAYFKASLVCIAVLLASFQLRAAPANADWNVAALDQILAGVKPGQKLVTMGDMQIRVSALTEWRNKLGGGPALQSAFDGLAQPWPDGNVYYEFSDSGTNAVPPSLQKAFLDAAGEWATFANVHFIPLTTQSNYVTVQVDMGLEGGQSAVGMIGGQQFLSVSPDAFNRGTLCHEIGHTLGLVHEHQRSDRDSYVTILTNNIVEGGLPNFVLLDNSTNETAYDFLSVMHYSRAYLSTDSSLDTIEPLPAYIQFINLMGEPGPVALSDADRAGMAARYGAGPGDSPVVSNTQDSGAGSLRTALYYAYDHPGTTITFNISTNDPGFANGVFTIQPSDELPWLVNGTTVDATGLMRGGLLGLQINGALVPVPGPFPNGLRLAGTNCVVRSLAINGFAESSILITGTNASGNSVEGCDLGTDVSGSAAVTNSLPPVTIADGAHNNTIGGTNAAARNIISGSVVQGISIRDAGTHGNVVEGNYIGLNAAGTGAISNAFAGIEIWNGAQSNLIGGASAAAHNVISGNILQGVLISDAGTMGNVVEGNYIGLNASGAAALANGGAGVYIGGGAQLNIVGPGNVLSGNMQQGVAISDAGTTGNIVTGNYIGLNPAGTAAISNNSAGVNVFNGAQSNLIGGAAAGAGNVISGNGFQGISFQGLGTTGNLVAGNYIGLNAAGTGAVPNNSAGVGIYDPAASNIIGGSLPGMGNVISGNANQGIFIGYGEANGNVIQGNYIGLDASGNMAVPNGFAGVNLYYGAAGNLIGGTSPGARNVISGNAIQGVWIEGTGVASNFVQGNYIGLNAAGNAAVPNADAGVNVYYGAEGNLIGGTSPGAGNVISGNENQGISIQGTGVISNYVEGNLIGLNAAGTAAVPNLGSGVEIVSGAQDNFIGSLGGRNFISGNSGVGVLMDGGAFANVIQGNTIGLNISNNAVIANGEAGVGMFGGVVSNVVGGTAIGAANLIAGNQMGGVELFDSDTTNNVIRGNSVFDNLQGGIGLSTGANNSQAAPTLTSAALGTNTTVGGNLMSLASTTFHLDFYASPPPSDSAQGKTYIGAKDVVTGVNGTAAFSASLGALVPAGQIITAMATDPFGNSSSMSSGITVTATETAGDGIPDAWRQAHFVNGIPTNSFSCATCDPDHDGLNNLQEFLSGTDPTNAASALQMGSLADNGRDIAVSFSSVQGVVYRIEYRDDIVAGGWSLLADQIIGTGGVIQITAPGAALLPKRFYRLDVLP